MALATRRGSRRVGSEARDTDPDAGSVVFPRRLSKPTGQQSDCPMKEQSPAPNCARRSGYEPPSSFFCQLFDAMFNLALLLQLGMSGEGAPVAEILRDPS